MGVAAHAVPSSQLVCSAFPAILLSQTLLGAKGPSRLKPKKLASQGASWQAAAFGGRAALTAVMAQPPHLSRGCCLLLPGSGTNTPFSKQTKPGGSSKSKGNNAATGLPPKVRSDLFSSSFCPSSGPPVSPLATPQALLTCLPRKLQLFSPFPRRPSTPRPPCPSPAWLRVCSPHIALRRAQAMLS